MAYFFLSNGLRGCYMPDSAYVIRVTTRRELKEAIADECRDLYDAGFVGTSKRAIARFAAEAWRNRDNPRWTLDLTLPYRRADQPGNWCFGVFLSRATRRDYFEYVKSAEC